VNPSPALFFTSLRIRKFQVGVDRESPLGEVAPRIDAEFLHLKHPVPKTG